MSNRKVIDDNFTENFTRKLIQVYVSVRFIVYNKILHKDFTSNLHVKLHDVTLTSYDLFYKRHYLLSRRSSQKHHLILPKSIKIPKVFEELYRSLILFLFNTVCRENHSPPKRVCFFIIDPLRDFRTGLT